MKWYKVKNARLERRAEEYSKQKHWENDLFVGEDNKFSTGLQMVKVKH